MKLWMSLPFFLLSTLSLADEMPSFRRLPGHGANCTFQQVFQNGPTTCGTRRFETWNCVTPGSGFTPATQKSYLLAGEYRSDVGGECSPTFVVVTVVEQKAP